MIKNNKNKGGFKVPEGYFEQFENKIPELIKEQSKNNPKKTKTIAYFYIAAASISLLILSTFVFLPTEQSNTNKGSINIELSDIDYYDINMDDIYYAYNDENIEFETEELNSEDYETINYIADELSFEDLVLLSELE